MVFFVWVFGVCFFFFEMLAESELTTIYCKHLKVDFYSLFDKTVKVINPIELISPWLGFLFACLVCLLLCFGMGYHCLFYLFLICYC